MKEPPARNVVSRKLFILMLLISVTFIGFSHKANAQGWSFTFQLAQSGPCGTTVPLVIPPLPNFGIPNKGACESLRQILLSIQSSTPITDDQGHFIGYCRLFLTCTQCTGSDIVIPGQSTPGSVSFDGLFKGEAYFTPHESSAFEDWAKDYKQLLDSYGITSILGNQLSIFQIPTTGDKKQDAYYKKQVDDFNPDVPDDLPPAQANPVKPSTGVVSLLTTPEEQRKRDAWYEENGFNNLTLVNSDNAMDEGGNQPAGRSIEEALLRTSIGEADGLAGVIGNGMLNTVDGTMEGLQTVFDQAGTGNLELASETANQLPEKVVVNAVTKTISDWVADKLTDIGFGWMLKSVSGAEEVHKAAKFGLDVWGNKQGK